MTRYMPRLCCTRPTTKGLPLRHPSSGDMRVASPQLYIPCFISTFFTCTHSYCSSPSSGARSRSSLVPRSFLSNNCPAHNNTFSAPSHTFLFTYISTVLLPHCISSLFSTRTSLSMTIPHHPPSAQTMFSCLIVMSMNIFFFR